jgi:hypothetical protein
MSENMYIRVKFDEICLTDNTFNTNFEFRGSTDTRKKKMKMVVYRVG